MQEVHECTDTSGPTVQVGPSTGVVSQPVRPAKTSREKNTPVWEQKAEINVSLVTSPLKLRGSLQWHSPVRGQIGASITWDK